VGLWKKIFGNKSDEIGNTAIRLFDGGSSVFTNSDEHIYANHLVRSAVHTFATHCTKLKFTMNGDARSDIEKALRFRPNAFMTLSEFLYRSATILAMNNTLFIVPVEDDSGRTVGFWPVSPVVAEIVERNGRFFLRYMLDDGKCRAVERERVGIISQHTFGTEFFGGDNNSLKPVLDLTNAQTAGLKNNIKLSAGFRFVGAVAQLTGKDTDLLKIKDLFKRVNLDNNQDGGVGLYDQRITDFKQIKTEPFALNAAQMRAVEDGVWKHFGISEAIIKNEFTPNQLRAFNYGKVEPFAKQFSEVMTNMIFSARELAFGNSVEFSVNEFDSMNNEEKLDLVARLSDRGLITINEGREIFGYKTIEGGDELIRRLDYGVVGEEADEEEENADGEVKNENG
jgi:hypothetical protein